MLGIRNPGFLGALSVEAPFSPLDLSPSLWLDAADATTITASLGSVSQWNDKSGNGHDATQASGVAQPVTGTRTIGGLNALDFTPTNNLSRDTATQLVDATTGHFAAFAVFVSDTVSGERQIVCQDTNDNPRMPQMLRTNGAAFETVRIAGGVFVDASGVTVSTGTTYVGASQHRTSNIEAYLNGSSNGATSTTGANGTSARRFDIGRNSRTSPAAFDGVIGEVIVYPKNLTNAEMNLVGAYLAAKWGGTWTAL